MKLIPNPYGRSDCFFCGPSNPVGLKLQFYETDSEPKEIVCLWSPTALYQGPEKILHGGIQSGVFDEIMGWTVFHFFKQGGVTMELNIRFIKPVFVERELEARCRIDSQDGKKVKLVAEIRNDAGVVCSEAVGQYLVMPLERFKNMIKEDPL